MLDFEEVAEGDFATVGCGGDDEEGEAFGDGGGGGASDVVDVVGGVGVG